MVCGYVQLKLQNQRLEDLQQFLKLESFGSFWSNKAGRVLLVTALTNLGSMLVLGLLRQVLLAESSCSRQNKH